MFAKKDRKIFTYHNGNGLVVGDPLELDRRFNRFMPEAANLVLRNWHDATDKDHPQPGKMPTEEAIFEAQNILVAAIRQAFFMEPFDKQTGLGAWEEDCLEAWDKFVEFMEEKKNTAESSPTSPNSTDGQEPSLFPGSNSAEHPLDTNSTSPSC